MPLVSIIMNCHNCSKYLPQALDSVYRQTFKGYEIIFWDNKSTDNSAEIALEYGEPLRYFQGDSFVTLGAARNMAIEKASGQYIAFLDCDDMWLPEKLEKQVELLDSNRELGLVYSDSYIINHKGEVQRNTHFSHLRPFRGKVFNELLETNFIPLLTAVVRRDMFDRVGVFSPEYEIVEEYDLWLRIAEYAPIDYIEQCLARFRIHNESTIAKNRELAFNECHRLMESWLNRKPVLRRELGGKINRKRVLLHLPLMKYHFTNHEYGKILKDVIALVKLLPHSLIIVPELIGRLGDILVQRYNPVKIVRLMKCKECPYWEARHGVFGECLMEAEPKMADDGCYRVKPGEA